MYETTMLKELKDMMTKIPVWFVGVDVSDYVNNGGYRDIISVHPTEEDAKKVFNNLTIEDDRTTVHETTLFDVVREMAMEEYFSGARWQKEQDKKDVQYYETKAKEAEQRAKAKLLETITKILK